MAKQKTPDLVMVRNRQPRCIFFGGVELKPGVNEVPANIADQMKKHPSMKALISVQKFEVTDKPVSTADMEEKEAIDLVKDVNDPDLLDKIEASDDRGKVKRAVKTQHEEIGPTAVKED